ncbi:cadherin-like domain-containing protein [Aphanizomenon sp. 202]|nr:cadherin-like domain-containing protein [Aphanizomenon sp. 202]
MKVIAYITQIIENEDGSIEGVQNPIDVTDQVLISDNLDAIAAEKGWSSYNLEYVIIGLSNPPFVQPEKIIASGEYLTDEVVLSDFNIADIAAEKGWTDLSVEPQFTPTQIETGDFSKAVVKVTWSIKIPETPLGYEPNIDQASYQYLLGANIQLVSEQLAVLTGRPINEILDLFADQVNSNGFSLTKASYRQFLPVQFTDIQKFAADTAIKNASVALTKAAYEQIDYDGDGVGDGGYGDVTKTYNIYDKIFRINSKIQVVSENLEKLLAKISRNELDISYTQFNNDFSTRNLQTQLNNTTGIGINVFAPQTEDFSRTIAEDTSYTFAVADFPFTKGDPDDTLKSIVIETTPLLGVLKLGDQEITGNTEVSVADIAAGLLTYTPGGNLFGTPFDLFGFRVTDGKFFSDEIHNVTFEVTGVNDAPEVSKNTGFTLEAGTTKIISRDILRATDSESPDGNLEFTLKALPQAGLVKLNGVDLKVGDTFTQSDIDNEKVIYVQNGERVAADSLFLEVVDSEGVKVAPFTVALTVQNPPTISAISAQTTDEDTAKAIAFTIGDVETSVTALTITATSSNQTLLPDTNLVLSGTDSNRLLVATPTENLSGTATITLTVNDGQDTSESQFEITVNSINDAPTLENAMPSASGAIADQKAKQDTPFSFTFDANTFIDIDPGDNLTYSATLKDGSNLPKWLKFNAATRTFIGTPTNADFGTLIVEVQAKDNHGVSATDTFALAVEQNNSTPTFNLGKIADDIFKISNSGGKSKIKVTLTERSSNLVNELGVFTVDDAQGNIHGIAPGTAGYAQAALDRSKVIFSAITNLPNGFNTDNLTHLLEFNSGDNLRFLLVKNGTIDSVHNGITPTTDILFSDLSSQKITDLGVGGFSLAWKDGSNNNTDFKDLVVNIKSTNDLLPLGTNLQGQQQGEVLDLRGITQDVKANFTVNREAAFNNLVGFYQVADENGGIDIDGNGTVDFRPGDSGYAQAAVKVRVAGIDLGVNNQGTATFTDKTLKGGSIFAPFILTNGRTVDQVLNGQVDQAYFAYLGANADKVDHIRLLGNNVFGFEDLVGGGDKDYNDIIVKVNLGVV